MTGIDLIAVVAPWLVFCVVLAMVCILLHRSRRKPERSHAAQDREPHLQEARCPNKNTEARQD